MCSTLAFWLSRYRVGSAIAAGIAAGRILVAVFTAAALFTLLLSAFVGTATAGPDACTNPIAGTTLCAGNQSAGVSNSSLFPNTTTLNVQSLTTAPIQPAGGVTGINIDVSGGGGGNGGAFRRWRVPAILAAR